MIMAYDISKLENNLQKRSQIILLGVLAVIVAGIVLATHWPALSARALSFDDEQYLVKNRLVQNPGWSTAGQFFSEILRPSTVGGYYQPLAMISLMLDYGMGGRVDNLRVFHLTSLALHVLNTALIVVLLYLLFGQPWAAAMAGLLFGVHPMTVESIPWVGERKTLLAACFVLLSLILYVLYTRRSNKKFLWTSLAMYVLALLSKPTSTPLPVLMLLLDFWPGKRLNWPARRTPRHTRADLRIIMEKAPFFVIGIISAVITFLSQKNTAVVLTPEKYSLMRIPLIICHNIIFYLYKIILPVNLSSHYPVPEPLALSHPMVLAGVVGTCLLVPALLISLRWTRSLLTGWLFFFIAIFPTLGVIGFTNVIASDKYAYLPSVGLLLPFSWLLCRFWGKIPRLNGYTARQIGLAAVVFLLVASEAAATRNYLVYWQDSGTLYRHMLSLAPRAFPLYNNLGFILYEQGKYEEAILYCKEAVRLNPDFAEAYNNIGISLAGQGKLDEAISYFNKAIRIKPELIDAYSNLGVTLINQGKLDEAAGLFRKILRIKPDNPGAYNGLGTIFAGQEKYDESISYFNKAIHLKPNYNDAYDNLGVVFANLGKMDEAIGMFRKALQIQPNDVNAHKYLGKALEVQGKTDEAVREYREALRINPDLEDVQNSLNALLEGQDAEGNN